MKQKYFLTLLLSTIFSVCAMAQTDYYYYKGQKIPLTLNEAKVCVSVSKDNDKVAERIRSNAEVVTTISDDALDIYVIPKTEFDKLTSLAFWEEDSKYVILTSSYFTQDNEEVLSTPYLNVRLKKEEDADLLASYAENLGLKIVKQVPLMPLWYILAVTPNNEKSPLQCANSLWESGNFEASVPDLATLGSIENTTATPIVPRMKEESSTLYDLQGRPIQGYSHKGIQISNGKKAIKKR